MAAVTIEGLLKRFGDTEVLKGVDAEVPEGSFAVLVGPSGCGKSTLLRLIAGLEQADGGTIHFDERDVTQLEPRERDVAMVFQSYALYPHLSVRENLCFGLKLRKAKQKDIDKRVEEAAAMLGLEPLLDRMPKALSGGQRQRVAMGRAIVRRPSLFLFDEPLSNLDAALRAQVRVDIRKLHDQLETTSVYVTHDQVEAMTLADVMFVLNRGTVEQAGPPLEVYDKPKSRFVAGFLGSPSMNFLEGKIDGDHVKIVAPDGEGPRIAFAPTAKATEGRAVTVGIRPHHVEVAEVGVPLEVTYTEALGGETYAYGKVAGQSVVVRLDAHERVAPGDVLKLRVEPESVQLFDADNGRSLRW